MAADFAVWWSGKPLRQATRLIKATDQAVIPLDADHAIVLFEFLSEKARMDKTPSATAESVVLDAILVQLGHQLVAPFHADYDQAPESAQA